MSGFIHLQVVVIDKGQIAEMGTHSELLARHGVYKRLVLRQLTAGNQGFAPKSPDSPTKLESRGENFPQVPGINGSSGAINGDSALLVDIGDAGESDDEEGRNSDDVKLLS